MAREFTVRNLKVTKINNLSPNMKRITIGGKELSNFPGNQQGGYVKIFYPDFTWDDTKVILPKKANNEPCMRTYTIRSQNSESQELSIDFVLHGSTGPASAWAEKVKIGDEIQISDPGEKKDINRAADWFFLVGDMTSLPAISVTLENLPSDAKGYVVINIIDENDRQTLSVPENMAIHWVVQSKETTNKELLVNKVNSLDFLNGQVSVWVACEFSAMRALRQYFRNEKEVNRNFIYISSYWKNGISEDKHKIVKYEDAQSLY